MLWDYPQHHVEADMLNVYFIPLSLMFALFLIAGVSCAVLCYLVFSFFKRNGRV